MKFTVEITVEENTDCDDALNGAWGTYQDGNRKGERVDVWRLMDDEQREQAKLAYQRAQDDAGDLQHSRIMALREEAAARRREDLREIARQERQYALDEAETHRSLLRDYHVR